MNMSQAVQLTKGLAKQHRAVLAVAEVMEEIVNLEDMRDAARKQSKDAIQYTLEALAEKEQIEKAIKKAKDELKNIEDIHEEMVSEAHKEANGIVIEASHKAKDIVGKAKTEAYLISSEMAKDRNVHMEEMEGLNKDIQEKEKHLNKIEASLVRIKERLG